MGLLVAVERGDQGMRRPADAVRDREDEHAPEQAEVGAGAGDVGVGVDGAAVDESRPHRHDPRQHVEGAREQQERLLPEAVEEEARDEDHQAEPDQAAPVICPSSVCVKPNSPPHSRRSPPRTAKPNPATKMVRKLAISSLVLFIGLLGVGVGGPGDGIS